MKKKLIAIALVIAMVFAVSACGGKDEPAQAQTSAPEKPEGSEVTVGNGDEASVGEPVQEPVPTGVEPDSGIYTVTSDVNGISFDYDSRYVAMQNPAGNIFVFAGTEAEIPYCLVSLIADAEAESYLRDMKEAAELELADALVEEIGEPVPANSLDRSLYRLDYRYYSEDFENDLDCVYIAEDLGDGNIVVYTYTAVSGETDAVADILDMAVNTFSIAK